MCGLKLPTPPVPRACLLKGHMSQDKGEEACQKNSFCVAGLTTVFLDDEKLGGLAQLSHQRNEPSTLSPWVWPGV